MIFSSDEDVELAFSKLSAFVTNSIEHVNFNSLQRAAIERARSSKMVQKSGEIVPIIKAADSFQNLCTLLADTPYWNFLDIRMLEAMATASMIPSAKKTIENFKKVFYGLPLSKVAPHFPIYKQPRPNHTLIKEDLQVDPNQMTIGELHKHRFYLETEMFQTGPDSLIFYKIIIGSVVIYWQIHIDNIYKVYTSLNETRHHRFLSAASSTLLIDDIEVWQGLPILWRGQVVQHVGPIEMLPYPVFDKRFPLSSSFHWTTLKTTKEVATLCQYPEEIYAWLDLYPQSSKMEHWYFGIRRYSDESLIGAMICVQRCLRVGKKLLTVSHILPFVQDSLKKQMIWNLLFKEAMRRANLSKISHALLYLKPTIIAPIATITTWSYHFRSSIAVDIPKSTKTPGWRRMKSEDVPNALALTVSYASRFEIAQVFQNKDEFLHYCLCDSLPGFINTFVVEDPDTGKITDLISYQLTENNSLFTASVTLLVAAKSPARQLVIDALVSAKHAQADILITSQFGLPQSVFEDLLLIPKYNSGCWSIYNYRYNETDEENFFAYQMY